MDDRFPTLAEAENAHILKALELADGNKTIAAQMLGIARKTMYRKLEEIENPKPKIERPARRRRVPSSRRTSREVEFDVF